MSVSYKTRSARKAYPHAYNWTILICILYIFAIQISDPISSTDKWQRSVFLVPSILEFEKERVTDRPAEQYTYFIS